MHNNNFFNPHMYQPFYRSTNLMNGFNNITRTGSSFGIGNNLLGTSNTLGVSSKGLTGIKGLLGKFSFSGFLNGASKTLNVVNQAIPVFYQVKPIFNNAKTMFRIMGAIKDDNKPSTNKNITNIINKKENNNINTNQNISSNYQTFNEENPTFFI